MWNLLFKLLCVVYVSVLGACSTFTFAEEQKEDKSMETAVVYEQWENENGDLFAWDGAFYSFVNNDGRGIKIWIPPTDKPVKGIILFGNPGGGLGGDTRSKSRQRDVVEFAARYNFAVGGVTGFPGRDTYTELGQIVLDTFNEWGDHGLHPELKTVPFIFSGSSNAGVFSFAMMMLAPERTICITPNVGPYYQGKIDDRVRNVPAWMHVGTSDPLFTFGFEDTCRLFKKHAPEGVLWAWEAEMKGHENGSSDHVDLAYWDAIIKLRMAENDSKLKTIDPAQGWYADFDTWDYDITRVHKASDLSTDQRNQPNMGWLPNEDIARIYQSAASRTRLLNIEFIEKKKVQGGSQTGTLLSSGGSQLMEPGEKVTIKLSLAPLTRGLETVAFYDRSRKIGEINPRETMEFSFTIEDQSVYCIHARATKERRGNERVAHIISNPLQIVVRQPELSAQIDAQLMNVDWISTFDKRALDPTERQDILKASKPATTDTAILSARLDGDASEVFKKDGAISSFWKSTLKKHEATIINNSDEANSKETDSQLKVSSAYNKDGLYLLFHIEDAKAGSDEKTEPGQLDFHIASVGVETLQNSRGSQAYFARPILNSLLCNALQMAFAVEPTSSDEINVNYWFPWDMGNTRMTPEAAQEKTGMLFDRVQNQDGSIDVELFLPWPIVGNPGFTSAPPSGTSLSTVIGYNSYGREAKFRWPHGQDPWAVSNIKKPDVQVFGEIRLMP